MSEVTTPSHAGSERDAAVARRARSSRLPAIAIVLGTIAATGALALVADNVSDRQETTLLKERSSEVSVFLGALVADLQTVLNGAGAAAVAGEPRLFETMVARSIIQGGEAVAARQDGELFTTIARAGTGPSTVGAPISAETAEVAGRALETKTMASGIFGTSEGRRIVVALPAPGDASVVTYLDRPLGPPTSAPSDPDSPYRDLDVALYADRHQDPDNLVLVSGDIPEAGGSTVTRDVEVGTSEEWLLAVSPRGPLGGSLAAKFPWLLLGAGTVLALTLGWLVEVLVRRRAYALKLVEERTKSLQEARFAAEKANRAKSEFLSRMSHELRTPLNAVLGFGQLLELDGLTPDQAENVNQITKGGTHLLDLINEILDISQIETGHMSMSPEAVLVGEVVDSAVSLLRPLAEESGVHLIGGTGHGCDQYIFADRQRLKQILLNLLGNGIKYNRQGGSVSISCFQPVRGKLRIQVTDTGPGIAADQLDLLFTPFERLGAEQTSVPGTGVGLALSRGLAEAMGGALGVDSTPGRGSTFWAEFPIVESPVTIFEESSLRSPRLERAGAMTIVHIEDNLANVQLVERVLAQRPELTVVPAMQGRMGVELARRHRPVLVLLDLNLVDLPGVEVLTMLREDPETADIPVAIVSADAMPRQVQRLLSSGAIAYLTKPIDIHKLLEVVDDAVQRASGTPATQPAGATADPATDTGTVD